MKGGLTLYKVVIIDDEDIIVNGLKKVIDWEKYGCKVVGTAYDAKSGAEAIREHKPDILFTDIRMPGVDGLTMLAAIKSEFPNMEITVLTGHREFEYAKRALNTGVTRFLLKPSKMNELEEALETMTENLEKRIVEPPIDPPGAADLLEDDSPENSSFIVNSALKYIDEHYAEKLTLITVADKIFVSQWYLSKMLNKHTGKSFYEIINMVRVKKAKQMLADPAIRIHEIAEMVGFSDVAHFSRTFKKLENLTPKEYRNRNS